MRRRTKRIILVSICTLAILVSLVWYTLPVLQYALFTKRKVPDINPRHVATLPQAPAEWDEIDIGGLKLKLPLSECNMVRGGEYHAYIAFNFKSHYVFVGDIAVTEELSVLYKEINISYPVIPYQQAVEIVNSSSSDISLFKSRARNAKAVRNQTLKGIRGEDLYEIDIVDPKRLKAICWRKARKDTYQASVTVYNQSETTCLHIVVGGCRNKQALQSVLLPTLAGISLPDEKMDIDVVRDHIRKIIEDHSDKKT